MLTVSPCYGLKVLFFPCSVSEALGSEACIVLCLHFCLENELAGVITQNSGRYKALGPFPSTAEISSAGPHLEFPHLAAGGRSRPSRALSLSLMPAWLRGPFSDGLVCFHVLCFIDFCIYTSAGSTLFLMTVFTWLAQWISV